MADKPFDLAMVFTGHMIDLPGRETPRFPQYAEAAVWNAIHAAIEGARRRVSGPIVGIASGARGGDLMFHDACRLFGIERRMILPFPAEIFVESSVAGIPNGGWEAKFWDNWGSLEPAHREVLLQHKDSSGYGLCNQRIIELAQSLARGLELLALWDGKAGDGPGGTADQVDSARLLGSRVEIIDSNALIGQHS